MILSVFLFVYQSYIHVDTFVKLIINYINYRNLVVVQFSLSDHFRWFIKTFFTIVKTSQRKSFFFLRLFVKNRIRYPGCNRVKVIIYFCNVTFFYFLVLESTCMYVLNSFFRLFQVQNTWYSLTLNKVHIFIRRC